MLSRTELLERAEKAQKLKEEIENMEKFLSVMDDTHKVSIHAHYKSSGIYGENRIEFGKSPIIELVKGRIAQCYYSMNLLLGE